MLRCKEVAHLLSSDAAIDGRLSDRLRIKLHLFMCKHCREYAAQLWMVSATGRRLGDEYVEEPEALEQLEKAILEQIDEPGGSDPGTSKLRP
jgi:anti-sigma factor RsiW